ncbi:MAG TPA: LPS export ABC transporter periplasmic protein LptC [Candidatus Eremiobacteraceae bacterium]|nr:LPS export ABC transporter periplasmic protein LptC [Candidatus Eremiobacteraceae bacterium]
MSLTVVALSGCGGRGAAVRPSATPGTPQPAVSGEPNYRFFETASGGQAPYVKNFERGKLVYLLKALGVAYTTTGKSGRFQTATIYFYKGSVVRLTVTAPTATVDGVTYDIKLRGGVHARSNDGTTLTSDSMDYNGKTKLLHADGHVIATGSSGMVVTGDRATADLDLQTINITGAPVTGAMQQP